VSERVVEAEAIEEAAGEPDGGDAEVRPVLRERSEVGAWKGEVRAIAVVAAGGLAAGAATVAAVSAARSRPGSLKRLNPRRRRERDGIIASRSFLVDVHVLGR
jgi:hypothetical protein